MGGCLGKGSEASGGPSPSTTPAAQKQQPEQQQQQPQGAGYALTASKSLGKGSSLPSAASGTSSVHSDQGEGQLAAGSPTTPCRSNNYLGLEPRCSVDASFDQPPSAFGLGAGSSSNLLAPASTGASAVPGISSFTFLQPGMAGVPPSPEGVFGGQGGAAGREAWMNQHEPSSVSGRGLATTSTGGGGALSSERQQQVQQLSVTEINEEIQVRSSARAMSTASFTHA